MAPPFSGRAGRLAAIAAAKQLEQQQEALGNAETRSLAEVGMGYDRAAGAYQPVIDYYRRGADLEADALGINGPEGTARARAAFTASPGYGFLRDEALQAAERGASAGGQLASGNLLTALQDRASGLAAQDYGSWRSALAPYKTGYGQAGTRLGDIGYGYGRDRSGVISETAQQRAGLGRNIAEVGLEGMKAGDRASQNRLNFGMQLGNTIASLAMGGFGKGGMFGAGGAIAPGGKRA